MGDKPKPYNPFGQNGVGALFCLGLVLGVNGLGEVGGSVDDAGTDDLGDKGLLRQSR